MVYDWKSGKAVASSPPGPDSNPLRVPKAHRQRTSRPSTEHQHAVETRARQRVSSDAYRAINSVLHQQVVNESLGAGGAGGVGGSSFEMAAPSWASPRQRVSGEEEPMSPVHEGMPPVAPKTSPRSDAKSPRAARAAKGGGEGRADGRCTGDVGRCTGDVGRSRGLFPSSAPAASSALTPGMHAGVDGVLAQCGVTEAQLAAAGFSPAETARLQKALWVYSQGLRQLFGELFGGPSRWPLLQRAWTGFACLLESTGEEGSVLAASSPLAAMARQQLEHSEISETMRRDGRAALEGAARASEAKAAMAAAAAGAAARQEGAALIAEAARREAEASGRAAAEERGAREAIKERDAEHRLLVEAQARSRSLDGMLRPLQAEVVSLREIRNQVPQLRQAAERLSRQLEAHKEEAAGAEAALRAAHAEGVLVAAEAGRQESASRLAAMEERLAVAAQAKRGAEQALALEVQKGALLQLEVDAKGADAKRVKVELLSQIEAAEAQLAAAREVRNAAELRGAEAEARVAAAEAEVEQRDEVIAAKGRQVAELQQRCRQAKAELKETRELADSCRLSAKSSGKQELRLTTELEAAQAQCAQLLGTQARLREEVGVAERVKAECEEAAWQRLDVLKKQVRQLVESAVLVADVTARQPGLLGPIRREPGCSAHSGGGPGLCGAWAGAPQPPSACAKAAHLSASNTQVHRMSMEAERHTSQQYEQEEVLKALDGRIGRMQLQIEQGSASRDVLRLEHAERLSKEKQNAIRLKFEFTVKMKKYERKAAEDAEQLAATVASFGGLVESIEALERDARELARTNQAQSAELREWKEAMAAWSKVPPLKAVSAPARLLRLLSARLAALGSSAPPGAEAQATGRPATAPGARASRLQSRRFHCL